MHARTKLLGNNVSKYEIKHSAFNIRHTHKHTQFLCRSLCAQIQLWFWLNKLLQIFNVLKCSLIRNNLVQRHDMNASRKCHAQTEKKLCSNGKLFIFSRHYLLQWGEAGLGEAGLGEKSVFISNKGEKVAFTKKWSSEQAGVQARK